MKKIEVQMSMVIEVSDCYTQDDILEDVSFMVDKIEDVIYPGCVTITTMHMVEEE